MNGNQERVYRCCVLSDTHVARAEEVPCISDAAAVRAAADLLQRSAAYAVEVWEGSRFVRRLDESDIAGAH